MERILFKNINFPLISFPPRVESISVISVISAGLIKNTLSRFQCPTEIKEIFFSSNYMAINVKEKTTDYTDDTDLFITLIFH
jgi:hypothetical protein